MIDIINGNKIHIQNGKIVDIEYEYDFHQYYEDKNSVLLLYLVLPGIRSNTIHFEVSGNEMKLTAFFKHEYERMFGSKRVLIEGKLKDCVLNNVFSIEYESGIAKVTLIIDKELNGTVEM